MPISAHLSAAAEMAAHPARTSSNASAAAVPNARHAAIAARRLSRPGARRDHLDAGGDQRRADGGRTRRGTRRIAMDAQGVGRDVDVAAVDRGHPVLARDAHRLARRRLGIGEQRVGMVSAAERPVGLIGTIGECLGEHL